MHVQAMAGVYLLNAGSEKTITVNNIRILGEETEDQPSHKVVQILPPIRLVLVGVILQ
jgi:hypothetical protein